MTFRWFPHRISRSPHTSQPFVLKVNTTLSYVTGNASPALTTADSLLAQPGVKQSAAWSNTHTRTHPPQHTHAHRCTQTHASALGHTPCPNQHTCMHIQTQSCIHSKLQAEILYLGIYPHFPPLLFMPQHCPLLIDFLFPWVVANVTFPAGAHTLVLSTTSHPGYKNTGSSLGVSWMEKKCPSLPVTYSRVFHAVHRDTRHDGRSTFRDKTCGTGDNVSTGMFTPQWRRCSDKVNHS